MDKELEQIVQRMIDAGESEENIALVIRKFDSVMGKQEGVQTAAATVAPATPEEPQQPTTFQQPSPLLEQELPIGVAAPREELIERDILFERDKGKPLSAVDPKAFDPKDYDAKRANIETSKTLISNNIQKEIAFFSNEDGIFDDEEGLVDDLQEAFGALAPGESEKLLSELKDIDFKYTDSVLNRIAKYYPEELGTLSQSSSRQTQPGYEKPMNAYQEDIIQNTVVGDSFEEDYKKWIKATTIRFEPGIFVAEALGEIKPSQEIVSQAIKNLHENKDLKSFEILRSIRNNLDESSEYALIKNTELFLKQYGDDLTINPIKDYVESVDLDSYTKKSTESSELIIDQSKVNPEDIIPGFEDLSSTSQESVRDFLSTQLTNKLESEKINDIASKQEDYEEFYDKIGDKIQNQLKNNSDLFAKSEEEFNAAKNALDDKYTTQFFNKQNKLFNVFSDRLIDLQRSYENGELSFEEFNNQANKLDSEYEEAFNALKTNIDKEYKNEGESVSLSIEQKYSDELNKEIQSLYNEYKLTPEEQKAYSDIYKKAREKLNEDRARYLIPEGSSPDASISALSGFYQSFKNEMGRQLSDLAVSTGSKDLGEYARGLENRYQLPKYGAGEAPFSMRAGKGIATSLPSLLVTAAGTRKLQKYTAPLSKFGTPGKIAAVGINLVGGALAGGATETAQMMASTRRQAIGSGKTVEEADKLADEVFNAQVANFYIYGLDALPFMKGAFKGINKVIPNRYIAGATKIGVGAGFEGVTETFQETVQTAFETQIDKSFNEIGVASYKDFEDNINLNLIKETFLEVYPSTMLMGGGSQALMMTKDEVDIWKEAAKNPKNIQNAIDVARITQGVDSQKALSQKVMWSMLTKGKDFTKAWINAASNLHLVSNTFNGSRGITAQQKSELLNLVDSQEQTINDLNDQTPNMSLLNKLVYNYIQDDINQLNAELESLKGKSKSKTKRNKIQKLLDRRSSELEQIENNPDQNSNALNIISIDNQAPFVLNDNELGNVLETSDNLFGRIANGKIAIDLSKTGKKVVSDAIVKSNINITNEIIDQLQNTPNVVLLKTEKEWENNIGQKREKDQTAINKNGKKYVYLPAASLTEDFSAASHELVHDVISPILFETGEDGKVLLDENGRSIISEEGHNLIDGFLNRLSAKERNALNVEFNANYGSRNDRDEYFTLYHRMLVQGNYKRSGLDKVRNLINSIIKSNGYTSGDLTAKGIQSFLKDYSNDIAVGRLSDNVKTFASKQIAKGVEVETIKFSRTALGDSIKALVPEGTTKDEYDSEVISTVYLDLVASNKLHPLINNNLARFGVPREQVTDEFYEDVKSQLFERSLQRFNPEKNDDLGGFVIDELQRFSIPDIVNQYKDQGRFRTTEQVEAAPTEGRVRPMQIPEETTTEEVVERAEDQKFKVQDKTFREKLGIEKGSDLYNSVIDSVRRTFGTKLPPVTNKKFRRALIDRFRRELMKPVKDFIGKGEKYKDFIFNNSELILQKIPTRELVRLERREETKIFAEIVSENSSPKQVDDAVSKGLYLLPGASRDSSPTIYRKIETTPEQLWNFLTGSSNDINSARKTALSERLAQELALDATMMVLKDPEFNLIAKVEEVSVMMGEPFPANYDAELGAIIERDPSMTRFSKKEKIDSKSKESIKKLINKVSRLTDNDKAREIVAKELRQLLKDSELSLFSKRTINKVITSLKNTNVSNMQKMLDKVDDAISNDEGRVERIKRYKDRSRAIKRIAKIGQLKELQESFVRVMGIDPKYLSKKTQKEYDSILSDILNINKKYDKTSRDAFKAKIDLVLDSYELDSLRAKEIADRINELIDTTKALSKNLAKLEKDKKITKEERELITRFKSLLDESSVEDPTEGYTKEDTKLVSKVMRDNKKRQGIEQDFIAILNQIQSAFYSNYDDGAFKLSELERRYVQEASSITLEDIQGLSLRDAESIVRALEAMKAGFLTPELFQGIIKVRGVRGNMSIPLTEIKQTGVVDKAISKATAGIINLISSSSRKAKKTGIGDRLRSAPTKNYDQILKAEKELFSDGSKRFKGTNIYKSLFRPTSMAFSASEQTLKRIEDKLKNATALLSRNQNKRFIQKAKIMVFQIQREYDSNVGNKEVNQAKDWINATIKDKDTEYNENEIKELEKIRDGYLTEGQVDAKKLYDSLTANEKKHLQMIDEVYEQLTSMARMDAAVQGMPFIHRENYIHLPKSGTATTEISNDFEGLFDSFMNASVKNKAAIQRTGKTHSISFDPVSNAYAAARKISVGYHMYPVIKSTRVAFSGLKSRAETNFQKDLVNELESIYDTIINSQYKIVTKKKSLGDNVVNYLTRAGYYSQLSGLVKAASELGSNTIHAVMNHAGSLVDGYAILVGVDAKTIEKAIENTNTTQTDRLTKTAKFDNKDMEGKLLSKAKLFNPEQMTEELAASAKTVGKVIAMPFRAVFKLNESLITKPDEMVIRPLFVGEFQNRFKQITGQKLNWEKLANDESYRDRFQEAINQASEQADAAIIDTSASTNPFDTIPSNISDPDASAIRRAGQVVNRYMTNFRVFEYYSAVKGVQNLLGKGEISRGSGAMLLASTIMRMSIYRLGIDYAFGLIFSMLGMGEDEDEIKKEDLTRSVLSGIVTLAFGRNLGNISQTAVNFGIEYANMEFGEGVTWDSVTKDGEKTEYNPYKDSMVFSKIPLKPSPGQDVFTNLMIGFTGPLSPTIKSVKRAATLTDRSINNRRKESRDKNRDELFFKSSFDIAGSIGLIPNYKDLKKLNDRYWFGDSGKKSKKKSYVPFEKQDVFEPPLFEPPLAE